MAANLNLDLKNLQNLKVDIDKILDLPMKVKIGIVAGVIVLVWGLYAGLVVFYGMELYPKYRVLDQQVKALLEEKVKKQDQAKRLPELQSEVAQLRKELEYAKKVLPPQEDIPNIINTVQENLVVSNLDILTFKPAAETKKQYYAEIPIALKFTGSFRDVGKFCDLIARYQRIINLTQLSIRDAKLKDDKMVVTADSTAIAYRSLKDSELPKAAAGQDKKSAEKK